MSIIGWGDGGTVWGIGAKLTPPPSSPIKEEVSAGGLNWIAFKEWRDTSPVMGEAGRGVG
ncbi:MAG: hypothetical protein JWP26_3089 [Devosia sp.]|nr:hypothetical protein [Devosia sp.]MDB5588119.1 hypothetical protein [Devosia sp.]